MARPAKYPDVNDSATLNGDAEADVSLIGEGGQGRNSRRLSFVVVGRAACCATLFYLLLFVVSFDVNNLLLHNFGFSLLISSKENIT